MFKRMLGLAAIFALVTHAGFARAQYIPPAVAAGTVGAIANGAYVGGYAGGYLAGAVAAAVLIGRIVAEGTTVYGREPDGMRAPYFGAPEPDPTRRISVQDCTKPIDLTAGNLMCQLAE